MPPHRPPRSAVPVLLAVLALAGCGGGEDAASAGRDPAAGPGTSTAGPAAATRELVSAVCAQTTRRVPPVPDLRAPAAEQRRYVRAVEQAMETLAPDLVALAGRDRGLRPTLTDLARRSRAVATVAGRGAQGRPGDENDLAATLAVLNVAATRAGLPQCGL